MPSSLRASVVCILSFGGAENTGLQDNDGQEFNRQSKDGQRRRKNVLENHDELP